MNVKLALHVHDLQELCRPSHSLISQGSDVSGLNAGARHDYAISAHTLLSDLTPLTFLKEPLDHPTSWDHRISRAVRSITDYSGTPMS